MSSYILGQIGGAALISTLLGLIIAVIARKTIKGLGTTQSYLIGFPAAAIVSATIYEFGTNQGIGISLHGLAVYGAGAAIGLAVMLATSLLRGGDDHSGTRRGEASRSRRNTQTRLEPHLARAADSAGSHHEEIAQEADLEYERQPAIRSVRPERPARRQLNGWRRLWTVLSAASALVALLTAAYSAATYRNNVASWEYDRSVKSDFETGLCTDYTTLPLKALREPDLDAPCYYVYSSRRYDDRATTPYSYEQYVANNRTERWLMFAAALAFCLLMAALGSALVYFLGWLVAWIRRGFRSE